MKQVELSGGINTHAEKGNANEHHAGTPELAGETES